MTTRAISELNEDCEILIRNEIEKCLVNYVNDKRRNSKEMLQLEAPELRQIYFAPKQAIAMKGKIPRMQSSSSGNAHTKWKYIDTPTQATDEKYRVPRSTVLSRARQHLAKRNSAAQSVDVTYRTVKTQTDTCAKTNVSVTCGPLDFLGLFEKSTNSPLAGQPGVTRDQWTQMYEHITQSELFCIEWIHKNLFEVKLNPNTLVVDDKLRDLSESPCIT